MAKSTIKDSQAPSIFPVVPAGSKRETNPDSKYHKYLSLQRRYPHFGVRLPADQGDLATRDNIRAIAGALKISQNAFCVMALRSAIAAHKHLLED